MNLEETNYFAYLYARQVHAEINKIIAPLHHLEIDHFAYFRVYDDGKYLMLSNNLELLKIYLNKISRMDDIFNKHAALTAVLKKHMFTLQFDRDQLISSNNEVANLIVKYNVLHEICITRQKDENSIEAFIFSNTRIDDQINEFYMNNYYLLEKFIDYFTKAAKHLIYSEEDNLAQYDQTFNFNKVTGEEKHRRKVDDFLKSLQIYELSLNTNRLHFSSTPSADNPYMLSKREKECLYHLSFGRTAKETALLLGIKFRTVERYIDSIRFKTGCHRKGELINLFTKISNSTEL